MAIVFRGKILFDRVYHNIGDGLSAILDLGLIKDRSPDDNYVLLNSRLKKESSGMAYCKFFKERNEVVFDFSKGFMSNGSLYKFNFTTNELTRISGDPFKNIYGIPICYNGDYWGIEDEYFKWCNITKVTLNKYSSHKMIDGNDKYTESKSKYIFGMYTTHMLPNYFVCFSQEEDNRELRTVKIYSTKEKRIKLFIDFKLKGFTYVSISLSETNDNILLSNYEILYVINKKTAEIKTYDINVHYITNSYESITKHTSCKANKINGIMVIRIGDECYELSDNGVIPLGNIMKENGLEKYTKKPYSVKSLGNNMYLILITDEYFIIKKE